MRQSDARAQHTRTHTQEQWVHLLKFGMQTRYADMQKTGVREQQKQKQNGVDGASGRLTLFNGAVHAVPPGNDSLGRVSDIHICFSDAMAA